MVVLAATVTVVNVQLSGPVLVAVTIVGVVVVVIVYDRALVSTGLDASAVVRLTVKLAAVV